jgi:xanthine dehydrogenase molybdopterin-binding subunit B
MSDGADQDPEPDAGAFAAVFARKLRGAAARVAAGVVMDRRLVDFAAGEFEVPAAILANKRDGGVGRVGDVGALVVPGSKQHPPGRREQ